MLSGPPPEHFCQWKREEHHGTKEREKWISFLLTLCMVLSLLPATAWAAGTQSCDGTHGSGWTALTEIESDLSTGKYYLSGNIGSGVTAYDNITISGDVTLCLNERVLLLEGHYITVQKDATFTLCDCQGFGQISGGGGASGGAVEVAPGGIFNMEGGTISGSNATNGGGVYVNGSTNAGSGIFNMSGGRITNCNATQGGGVFVTSKGTFNMSGGTISGNEATGTSYGGGVYVKSGTFNLEGGTIGGTST